MAKPSFNRLTQQPTATAGIGTITVSWPVPASNGGFAITDYIIEYRTRGSAPTARVSAWKRLKSPPDSVSSSTSLLIDTPPEGNGLYYQFRIMAVNANKEISSPDSMVPSNTVTPLSTPSAPLSLKESAPPSGLEISLSFTTPERNGGKVITSYVVEYAIAKNSNGRTQPIYSNDEFTVLGTIAAPATNNFKITMPQAGDYAIRIAAINSVGQGPYSNLAKDFSGNTFYVSTTAGPPTNFRADKNGAGEIFLAWDAPIYKGRPGSRSIYYVLEKSSDQITWKQIYSGSNPTTDKPYIDTTSDYKLGESLYYYRVKLVSVVSIKDQRSGSYSSLEIRPYWLFDLNDFDDWTDCSTGESIDSKLIDRYKNAALEIGRYIMISEATLNNIKNDSESHGSDFTVGSFPGVWCGCVEITPGERYWGAADINTTWPTNGWNGNPVLVEKVTTNIDLYHNPSIRETSEEQWLGLAMHELLHGLGVGSGWPDTSINNHLLNGTDYPNTLVAYNQFILKMIPKSSHPFYSPRNHIPIEMESNPQESNADEQGSIDVHWENTDTTKSSTLYAGFKNELLNWRSSFLRNVGILSDISVQNLVDSGYVEPSGMARKPKRYPLWANRTTHE